MMKSMIDAANQEAHRRKKLLEMEQKASSCEPPTKPIVPVKIEIEETLAEENHSHF